MALDLNKDKNIRYVMFLNDYSYFCLKVIDSIWSNGYGSFNVKNNDLNIPKYIDYKKFKHFSKTLSARAMSSAVTQVSQIIKSCVEKQRRINWVNQNKNKTIKNKVFSKPKLDSVYPMLSSKCCDFQYDENGKLVKNLDSQGDNYTKTDSNSNFERAFPINISKFNFRMDNKVTVYDVEAKMMNEQIGFGVQRGIVKSGFEIAADNVANAIQQLLDKVNNQQELMCKKSDKQKYPDVYKVSFEKF